MPITVQPLDNGAAVQFPKDAALNNSFKSRFPKARWDAGTASWHIPGKLAVARAQKWASEHEDAVRHADREVEQERRDAEWEGRESDPVKALIGRRKEIRSRLASVSDTGVVTYPFPYNDEAIAIARSLPGARFDRAAKAWSFRPTSLQDVEAIIAGCARILEIGVATNKAEAARKAEREAEWARQREAERIARNKAREEETAGSEVWLQGTQPREGVPFEHRGRFVVATRTSARFRVDLDAFAVNTGGAGLPSLEDEWCVRVWLRPATAADQAAHADAEASAAAAARAEKERIATEAAAADAAARELAATWPNDQPVEIAFVTRTGGAGVLTLRFPGYGRVSAKIVVSKGGKTLAGDDARIFDVPAEHTHYAGLRDVGATHYINLTGAQVALDAIQASNLRRAMRAAEMHAADLAVIADRAEADKIRATAIVKRVLCPADATLSEAWLPHDGRHADYADWVRFPVPGCEPLVVRGCPSLADVTARGTPWGAYTVSGGLLAISDADWDRLAAEAETVPAAPAAATFDRQGYYWPEINPPGA